MEYNLNKSIFWKETHPFCRGPAVSQNELNKNELPQSIAQSQKNHALIQLLKSWREGDEQEQRNTWEYLKQALDEDRLSERKLFP